MIKKLVSKPVFYIFSDEIECAKQNLKLNCHQVYVDLNQGADSYKDLQLMSLCQHNIIANSSFSWWGAWLNKNKAKLVLAPSQWFNGQLIGSNDIIPESWIKVRI